MPKDDDIDQLFQDAADRFQPARLPEDWPQMATLLDRKPARKTRPVVLALVVLGLLAGGILLLRAIRPAPARCPGCSTSLALNHSYRVPKTGPVSNSGPTQVQVAHVNPSGTAPALSGPDRAHSSQRIVRRLSVLRQNPSGPSRRGYGGVQLSSSPRDNFTHGDQPHIDAGSPGSQGEGQGNHQPGEIPFNMPPVAMEVFGKAPVDLETQAPPVPKVPQPPRIRWQADLLLGPDLTLVSSSLWSSPGMDAGLGVSYHFSEKWQLETALLYSSKIYKALPSEYHPTTPYNNNGMPDLQQISANCRVIDLALDARYNFKATLGGTWFAEAGLSSYWMNREAYTFNYKSGGYPASTSWAISNEDRHPLSILNLSAGYEFRLSRRVSWQAQAFLKLPLSGIGYGRVRLVSTGMLFSFNYGF